MKSLHFPHTHRTHNKIQNIHRFSHHRWFHVCLPDDEWRLSARLSLFICRFVSILYHVYLSLTWLIACTFRWFVNLWLWLILICDDRKVTEFSDFEYNINISVVSHSIHTNSIDSMSAFACSRDMISTECREENNYSISLCHYYVFSAFYSEYRIALRNTQFHSQYVVNR